MNSWAMCRRTAAMAILVPLLGEVAPARAGDITGSLAYDFMVQNVCIDPKTNRPLPGVSPIDGDPRCTAQRNLAAGELLPYHKRDGVAARDRQLASGQQGSDSIPAMSKAFGPIVIHTYDPNDLGSAVGFNHYDPDERRGGGTVEAFSDRTAYFLLTQYGAQTARLFVNGQCEAGSAVGIPALQDSWILAPLQKLNSLSLPASVPDEAVIVAEGSIESHNKLLEVRDGTRCPDNVPSGTTHWYVEPVTYNAVYKEGPLKGRHVRLWTLVAERFSRDLQHVDAAPSMERVYFTRELGRTRWEAWKSKTFDFSGNPRWKSEGSGVNEAVEQRGKDLLDSQACDLPAAAASNSMPAAPAGPKDTHGRVRPELVINGCKELTVMAPSRVAEGDPPPLGAGSWYATLIGLPKNDSIGRYLASPR